nr:MAG TPA: hypothetical protein [Crassvirales sp.]
MKKELTSAEKSRVTKLSKKSNEELVDIIIRKDDVERRKDKLIACLKTNIAGLENKISNTQEDLRNAEVEYADILKKHNTLVTIAQHKQNELNDIKNTLKANDKFYKDKLDVLQDDLCKAIKADGKYFILGMFVGSIIFAIMCYLF